ncbi:MAG: rRNA maturation RNase YbeY, partial [Thermotogae bacterium]
MLKIHQINRTKFPIDTKIIENIATSVLKKVSNIDSPVSIAFVGENTIKKLNKEYRGIDSVTDVLTFIYRDDDQYGEIVMCPSKITRNARKFSETFEK